MAYFKAALMVLEKIDVAVVWLDKKYMNQEEELKKHFQFYKNLLDIPNIALMMLDDKENPVYFGKKEVVEVLKKNHWKKYPWQSFELGQSK